MVRRADRRAGGLPNRGGTLARPILGCMANPVILVVDADPAGLAAIERELLDRYARPLRRRLRRHRPRRRAIGSRSSRRDRQKTSPSCSRDRSSTTRPAASCSPRCAGSIRTPSARCSSGGATGASARPATRSSRRSSTGRSTTTSSGPWRRRTSSSTTRSRRSCSSGPRNGAPRRTRSRWSATPGRAGRPQLRDVLERCAFPHAFCLADSDEGRQLLGETHRWHASCRW